MTQAQNFMCTRDDVGVFTVILKLPLPPSTHNVNQYILLPKLGKILGKGLGRR